ncbi:MAG: Ldh family oxidoreductase [Spirochaetia bacterium]|nr:Ldh family oxidoreductase [Spirochaetia bacterium]MCF7942624.1 Ldh family oxidoreductase [Spirochaetia bacterium]
MKDKQPSVSHDRLLHYLQELYQAAGLSAADADVCAQCTVKTNLWGVDSHGVLRTPVYIERILKKAINPTPEITYEANAEGPFSLMNGDGGMGYVVATRAMEAAIEKARRFGIGIVLVKNSNHFGAASLFTRMASDVGMLGAAVTNVKPNIGMPGAKAPVTGNNPLALAAPIGQPYPFSLDISMSAVSGGKILLAQKKGEKIPDTWAIDADGNPTDDPFKGFAGILLPTGMHKGLGLSFFIDIITGVMSGGPFLQDLKSMYKHADEPSLTSHLLMAIDPAMFQSRESYEERIAAWAAMIKATPMTDPSKKQIIPGEIEYMIEQTRKAEGIPIPPELIMDLTALEERLGLSEHLPVNE